VIAVTTPLFARLQRRAARLNDRACEEKVLTTSVREAFSLSAVRQLFEQSLLLGDVPGVLGLQSPQKHLCRLDVMAASIQRRNHPILKGDALRHPLQESFDRLQPLLQSRLVHSGTLAAKVAVRAGL